LQISAQIKELGEIFGNGDFRYDRSNMNIDKLLLISSLQRITGKQMVSLRDFILLTVLLSVGVISSVSATGYVSYGGQMIPDPLIHIPIPENLTYNPEDYDYFYIDNVTLWLTWWNDRMDWGFSSGEINNFSTRLENDVFTYKPSSKMYRVDNASEFIDTLPDFLNLTCDQGSEFIAEYERLKYRLPESEVRADEEKADTAPREKDHVNEPAPRQTEEYVPARATFQILRIPYIDGGQKLITWLNFIIDNWT
jgi:hypothetical protein